MIRIELERNEFRTDERVKGRAVWESAGGKTPRKIEVSFRWRVVKPGQDRVEVVDNTVLMDVGERAQVTVPFDFEIPPEGPLSYNGALFSIAWEVFANADLPWARDESETAAVTVRPKRWVSEEWGSGGYQGTDDFESEEPEDQA